MLYNMISDPGGLSQWFATVEPEEEKIYTFNWPDSSEKARLEMAQPNSFVRFRWLEREEDEYLTLEVSRDELTDEVALIITDFDYEDEIEEASKAWEVCIDELKAQIGA